MATFTTRTITSTRREWAVPAAEPFGAAAEEISKAWQAADMAYRELHRIAPDVPLSGNALTFHVTDDAVVISFTVEEATA